jgi:hypothetical protein
MSEQERDRYKKSIEALQQSDAKDMGDASVILFALRSAAQPMSSGWRKRKKEEASPKKPTLQEQAVLNDMRETSDLDIEGMESDGQNGGDFMYERSPEGQRIRHGPRKFRDPRPGSASSYDVFGPEGRKKAPGQDRGGRKASNEQKYITAMQGVAQTILNPMKPEGEEELMKEKVDLLRMKKKREEEKGKREQEKYKTREEKARIRKRKEEIGLFAKVTELLVNMTDVEDKRALVKNMGLTAYFPSLFPAQNTGSPPVRVHQSIHPSTHPLIPPPTRPRSR